MKTKLTERIEQKLDELKPKAKNPNYKSGYGLGLKISLDLISSTIVGILIGLGIDKIFSTKPIFFVIFLVLGIIAGFINLYRTIKKID
ncbi:MAG: AtpZ/AtpI family protein [Pseudomonadota bacterium]|nr:AtpZ/AtpI family protein [Pseudomonadota bacterium]